MLQKSTVIGTAIYPMSKVLADYLVNSLGESGSEYNPVTFSNINQILLTQWKYMKSIKSLYFIVLSAKQGRSSAIIANQAIAAHNRRNASNLTMDSILEGQLESKMDGLGGRYAPQSDPWIFYKTKEEYSIYDILNFDTPPIPGRLTEYEQQFLPYIHFMDVLYFADWSAGVLKVMKSLHTDNRALCYDQRTTQDVKERFRLPEGYFMFEPNFIGETEGTTFVLSPELEQSLIMEMTHPELV